MALTDIAVKALKPKPKTYVVTDDRGLYIEVSPVGGKTWRYRYRLNKKQEKVTIGRYPDMPLKAARQRRDALALDVACGESPAKQRQLDKRGLGQAVTVRIFGERYFRDIVERDRKDPSSIRAYLDKDIYPTIGSKPMRGVTPADVQKIVYGKRDHGFEAAAAVLRNILKRLFDYAIALEVVPTNPVASLPTRFISRQKSRERALSPEEIRIYLASLYQSNMRRQFKLALHLILLTMVRKGELLKASWEHIDFNASEWEIPTEHSKTRKPHVVYLSAQAVALFQELKGLAGDSDLVLPGRISPNRPFSHNALNKAFGVINIPIPSFTIHDLRRTAATRLHEAGFPPHVVEKALNHTIGGIRGVYNRAEYGDQRREMLQFWADYVADLMTEKKVILGQFQKPA